MRDSGFFNSPLKPSDQNEVIKLTGKQCTIRIQLNEKDASALYDTGAQACLLSERWLKDNHLIDEKRSIDELLEARDLELKTATDATIPYTGWIVLQLRMNGWANTAALNVPFLITSEELQHPIIGTNVIEEVIKRPEQYGIDQSQLLSSLQKSFSEVDGGNVAALVKTIKSSSSVISRVKVCRKQIVKKGSTKHIPCRVRMNSPSDTTVLFQPYEDKICEGLESTDLLLKSPKRKSTIIKVPVRNSSSHDITLLPRTQLGWIEHIASLTPLHVQLSDTKVTVATVHEAKDDRDKDHSPSENPVGPPWSTGVPRDKSNEEDRDAGYKMGKDWTDAFNLSHLNAEEERIAREMLRKEVGSFSLGEEIGSMNDVQMHINLKDSSPVQKKYNSVPHSLYGEVKGYVEDLLNK